MENIFQNSHHGVGGLFSNVSKANEEMFETEHENLFIDEEHEPKIVFEQSFFAEKPRINDTDNKLLFKMEEKEKNPELLCISADNIFEKTYKKNSFLKKYFPKLYGRKILKAVNKRIEIIEKNTKNENSKQIPFGENEKIYNNLAQNLSEINYLQSKLDKEIK